MNWTANLAYVVGLITTDGCLYRDGRHIDFTSKDLEQIENFRSILNINNKIGKKARSTSKEKNYFRVQFSNVVFWRFLESIGLSPKKSKILEEVKVPDMYFADFFRGCLDGDGFTYSYWDKRWPNSFRFYTGLTSASMRFLEWMKGKIKTILGVEGKITKSGRSAFQLMFAKKNSIILWPKLYYSNDIMYLSRKKSKIDTILGYNQLQSFRNEDDKPINMPRW